jgi:hypothetical protein
VLQYKLYEGKKEDGKTNGRKETRKRERASLYYYPWPKVHKA